ncbi:MAG: RNase adapter RapZ [Pseudomonadota bacterium]|nr:RNase adapter RapZ [Pseudomonadota bacterium]
MDTKSKAEIMIVTGLSGAGRSTCLKLLEDYNFEAIDNLPLTLISDLLSPLISNSKNRTLKKIAIGVDPRTRGFSAQSLLNTLEKLQLKKAKFSIIFLDCNDENLIRRFTETRRKHPLANDRPVSDGIRAERRLLEEIRQAAHITMDSSNLTLPEFQILIKKTLNLEKNKKLTVTVISFGFRNGLPPEADMIFDVRFLSNPHYNPKLQPLDGRQSEIANFIEADPAFKPFFDNLTRLLNPLFPRYSAEGKSYLTIAFGCTGGKHRSVFVAEKFVHWLQKSDYSLSTRHRDLTMN